MEGGTLLTAWRSFKETLPDEVAESALIRLAFAAGASWATERLTSHRDKVRRDAMVMLEKAKVDITPR